MLFNGMFLHFCDLLAGGSSVLLLSRTHCCQELERSWAAELPGHQQTQLNLPEERLNHWVFPLKTQLRKDSVQTTVFQPTARQ